MLPKISIIIDSRLLFSIITEMKGDQTVRCTGQAKQNPLCFISHSFIAGNKYALDNCIMCKSGAFKEQAVGVEDFIDHSFFCFGHSSKQILAPRALLLALSLGIGPSYPKIFLDRGALHCRHSQRECSWNSSQLEINDCSATHPLSPPSLNSPPIPKAGDK